MVEKWTLSEKVMGSSYFLQGLWAESKILSVNSSANTKMQWVNL